MYEAANPYRGRRGLIAAVLLGLALVALAILVLLERPVGAVDAGPATSRTPPGPPPSVQPHPAEVAFHVCLIVPPVASPPFCRGASGG